MMAQYELNARRLLCPMPVIKTQQKVKTMQAGDILNIYATDPGAMYDIPAWCRMYGHKIVKSEESPEEVYIQLEVVDIK